MRAEMSGLNPLSRRDAERIAGKRRAENTLAKLDDAAPRVRFTGWLGTTMIEAPILDKRYLHFIVRLA